MSRSRRSSPVNSNPVGSDRREFMKTTGAAAAAGAIVSTLSIAQSAHAAGSDVLKVGLVGAGGRGTGAALQALKADKNVKITAIGDAFPEELASSIMNLKKSSEGERVDVPAERQFVGFDAYKKVIDSGIDIVLLAAPPHFRPEHMEYAVKAGKHVFAEKPVAVDAQGVHRVIAAGEEAKKKNLTVVSGLCWRYDFGARAGMEQVNSGAVGDIAAIYAAYKSSGRPKWPMVARTDKMSDMEYQLRNWYYYTWLSGDSITEQAIHSVDKACWAMKDEPPLSCTALGGLQARLDPERGNIYDHFSIVYDYAGGVKVFFDCCQIPGVDGDVSTTIMGSKGVATLERPKVEDRTGATVWRYTGPKNVMHQQEHDDMFAALRAGKTINNTLYMARSTMVTIMGRMAAYTGKRITWEQAMNSQENLTPAGGYVWGNLNEPPIAVPGVTRFV